MNQKRQFIFVMEPGKLKKSNFSDLYQGERVIVLDDPMKTIHSKLLTVLRRLRLRSKVNGIINLPFKWIWKPSLVEIDWQDDDVQLEILESLAEHSVPSKYRIIGVAKKE